ncbi:hypothetical protein BKI52_20040 [marine bacterium AO1-C]|nr:hypothetical protein BKI52_20040 [marine bacterium AO1-C]
MFINFEYTLYLFLRNFMNIDPSQEENPQLDPSQKLSLALYSTELQSNENSDLLNEWCKNLTSKVPQVSQPFHFNTTHTRNRVTLQTSLSALTSAETFAHYFQNVLGVSPLSLRRLQKLGENWQPTRLGSWLEFNTLGINAGWFFPIEMIASQLTEMIENTTHRKIITRWVNTQNLVECISYGESLVEPIIRQMEFRLDSNLALANQYHLALNLADLLEVPSFHGQLLNILERYEATELIISLWLSPEGVLKFGLRIMNPSVKLLIALFMLSGMSKKEEDKLAVIHGVLENIAWVEIQQTADGLTSEVSYKI